MKCVNHSTRIHIVVALLTLSFFHAVALGEVQVQDETTQSTVPVVVRELAGIKTSDRIRLGSQVTVCIKGLHRWIKEGNDPNSLRLFLGGRMLSSIEPSAISPASQDYVNFTLEFDSADKHDRTTWAEIFDAVRNSDNDDISVTVGDSKSRQAFESDIYATFVLYPWFTRLAILLVLFLLVTLILLARNTDLLRDTYTGHPEPPAKAPFSLSRVQMAWWFYLVIAAYVYIWLVTQVPHIPTGSVLGLLGISATTGLAAVAVDKNKRSDLDSERTDLEMEELALSSRTAEIQRAEPGGESPVASELQAKKSRLAEVKASLLKLPPPPAPARSRGVIDDLLRDGGGVSFHRFQIAVWTVVLGMVFIRGVYKDFSMPEFDPALLALMGVYSGTYVGFKFPEKPKT